MVSQVGNQFNYVALAWLVLQETGSTLATGGVFLAQIVPDALFGWVAGVAVDRSDRRRLMIDADLARAALVLILPLAFLADRLELWLIYGVTFLVSTLSLVFIAAHRAALPQLVPAGDLVEANAYSEASFQVASFAGPAVAGVLVAALPSPAWLLFADAATFLVSGVALVALRWRDHPPEAPTGLPTVLREALEGVRFLVHDRFLRVVFLTATAGNFLVMPYAVIFPIFADRELAAGAAGFGSLMGAFGGGLLLGSVLASALSRKLGAPTLIFGGMGITGASLALLGAAPTLPPALILAAAAGFAVAPGNAVVITLLQSRTPERLQGRVFASLAAVVGFAAPLGVGLATATMDSLGPRALLHATGAAVVLTGVVGALALRPSRERAR